MNRRTRRMAARVVVALAMAAGACARPAQAGPVVTVYKSPTCGCCHEWVEHMRRSGFEVKVVDRPDVAPVKREHHVPAGLESCHTALVGGYVLEGHVPADVVRKLLAERPATLGLAVPGMPAGSPGMESAGKEPYEVYTFDASGPRALYAAR